MTKFSSSGTVVTGGTVGKGGTGGTSGKSGTSPWSYVPSSLSSATEEVLVQPRPENIVLEPSVLKGQYLTKVVHQRQRERISKRTQ